MFKVLTERKKKRVNNSLLAGKGQVILEFTFCMIIVLLMIFGITKVFVWSGREYVGRSTAHDSTLYLPIERDYGDCVAGHWDNSGSEPVYVCDEYSSQGDGPLRQIDPYFYTPVKMNAIWKGN